MPLVRQVAYIVGRGQKMTALGRILDFEGPKSAIVFCRTRIEVDELTDTLNAHGYGAQALHGGMVQKQRDRVMQLFRSEQADILVATDVAARGLDIDHVSHVINFDLPTAPEVYVHRIGRTGRIGREGMAITLANPREHRFLKFVEALTKQKIEILNLPTEADLKKRRLEATKETLREQLAEGGLDEVREIVESLVQDFDILDVAAAAVKMIHDAFDKGTGDGEVDESREEAPRHGSRRPRSAQPTRRPLAPAAPNRADDAAAPQRRQGREHSPGRPGRRDRRGSQDQLQRHRRHQDPRRLFAGRSPRRAVGQDHRRPAHHQDPRP